MAEVIVHEPIVGVWHVNPNTTDRTVSVTVNTNGRCVVGVGIK